LLDRKGEVKWVVVGEATRLYLPDIGRVRGGLQRLRGLRLVVARPTPLNIQPSLYKTSRSFCLSHDFKTDLEKLRLDAVIEIDASRDGVDGPLVLGYLGLNKQGDKNLIQTREKIFRSAHDLSESFTSFIDGVLSDLAPILSAQQEELQQGEFLEKALLVGAYQGAKSDGQYSMIELAELARSARVRVVDQVIQWRHKLDPKTVIGIGKLEEICLHALALGVDMVIFDHDLSPSQLNNISILTDLKILDRTMLILDIFAQRAVTREGKVQVEMAQLSYSLPRLSQKQSGLSRLSGGIGGRGPGETKLEVNKRRVKDRLARLDAELEKIEKQRELRRKVRNKNKIPTLAIIGYTNAGKSSLLNALSGSDIYAKDELFATLDPHSRRLRFPKEHEVLVTDTVGFINNLPKSLMKAFKATLEELQDADILLHVVDIADKNFKQHIQVVEEIISELDLTSKPKIVVFNKIDKLSEEEYINNPDFSQAILISTRDKRGFVELINACVKALESLT
jgi:GTP-binding protein HflX